MEAGRDNTTRDWSSAWTHRRGNSCSPASLISTCVRHGVTFHSRGRHVTVGAARRQAGRQAGVGALTRENIFVSVLLDVVVHGPGLAGQAQPAPQHGSLRTHHLPARTHTHTHAHRQTMELFFFFVFKKKTVPKAAGARHGCSGAFRHRLSPVFPGRQRSGSSCEQNGEVLFLTITMKDCRCAADACAYLKQ